MLCCERSSTSTLVDKTPYEAWAGKRPSLTHLSLFGCDSFVNILSTSNLADKTPYEAWAGKIPSLAHLRVFGCDPLVHIPKERRQKLDSKSEKCIFVGYKDGVKGYKL